MEHLVLGIIILLKLYDQEVEIIETAIDILEEACEDEVSILFQSFTKKILSQTCWLNYRNAAYLKF